jgi:hypothetical protein
MIFLQMARFCTDFLSAGFSFRVEERSSGHMKTSGVGTAATG